MSDIFREIEQEVRREEALKLWTKYQIPLIALAVLIVAATAAWRFWENGQRKQAEAAGARYEAAMKLAASGKTAEALKGFDSLVESGPAGYALLSKLQAARVESSSDPKGALKLYDGIAADRAAPPSIRDVARLRAAYVAVDGTDQKAIQRRLEPLAAPGYPFHALARELLGLQALKQKDYRAAGHWFDSVVADPQAPAPTRARAEAFLGLVASAPRAAPTSGRPTGTAPAPGAITAPPPAAKIPSAPSTPAKSPAASTIPAGAARGSGSKPGAAGK